MNIVIINEEIMWNVYKAKYVIQAKHMFIKIEQHDLEKHISSYKRYANIIYSYIVEGEKGGFPPNLHLRVPKTNVLGENLPQMWLNIKGFVSLTNLAKLYRKSKCFAKLGQQLPHTKARIHHIFIY